MNDHREILIFENGDELSDFALEKWREISGKAIKDRESFAVALSGGKTPVGFYRKLAGLQDDLSWNKTDVFLVDERFVPFDSDESNYGMIKDKLLNRVRIPAGKVHPVSTGEDSLQAAAKKYEGDLKEFFKLNVGEFPEFDLIMLGIGEDGHTASLFPGTSSLTENERLAIAVDLNKLKNKRISLTLPVINNAKNIIFLISGHNKAKALREILEGKEKLLPASRVKPGKGRVFFLLDKSAGAYLSHLIKVSHCLEGGLSRAK